MALVCVVVSPWAPRRNFHRTQPRLAFETLANKCKVRDAKHLGHSCVNPELPGCASAGETEEEARRNIEEAIRLYLSPAEIELSPTAKLVEVTVG